ncbi:hypothetical protein LAJ19_14015 (plasmid) [Deinococcus taeanensis]|uniref:hypothetical protein n=1 Tax=Deinococcus taeanensis TaxID=2737050 RepID=UPI001CDC46D0|nr:hypothetical protein [Deinococcus taeanensis]UBV44284.1 hypothetical protein LAJ19_14015 [Deinococcus taeanensis]
MKVRQLEALLVQRGWTYQPRIGTPHRHWLHPAGGLITFSGNTADECDPAQVTAVLARLGLSRADLLPDTGAACAPGTR